MGRHSIPDPDESAGEEQPEEPQTERFGDVGDDEPDGGPTHGEPEYSGPGDGHTEHPDLGYREPSYGEPENDTSDDHPEYDQSDSPERDYPEPDRAGSAPPPPTAPRSGRQHGGEWEGGEWTGSHRAVTTGRRGVSLGVIAALIAVVVVVGAIILWRFFGDALSNRSDVAAARCVAGELAVAVVADPSISDQIQTLANTYNETATPVGDRCVKVGVKPADPDQVVNGFVGNWPAELGERPALWIPASSVSGARLESSAGAQTISDSRTLVTSPVLLAIRPQLKAALRAAELGHTAVAADRPRFA